MTLINREKLKNWLFISLFLMGVVIFSNFCHTLTTYFGQNQDQYTGLKLFFSCIAFLGILSLNFYMNFNPELVYNGFKGSLIKEELAINNAIKKPDFLKELVEVEIKDADLLLEKIRSALEDKKFFLGKGLTIVDLAKNIDVSPKILSILINRKFKTNFNELINIYRVNYAKQLLEENVLALYSIEGLASMVGFNSRITFFNSFKKNVGISPKEYAKSLLTAKELAS
ncbi:MAG: helix-turn-helix transcriptional regulator [Candidatus Pedobacter colombiensis]|uniref:Helix-turn-helix transcriptional regulator n=1 Tax=Candidatus Pedobacter colombiensis TaxID=3121371 RepID=A0AAJ5W7P2_9SPHI|nr:helix-turn-helix transcriptional regulator [Pedobacter sp.]WEK19115.1 MAG: helix-turn-helix transcriptional regulator [Pedobacter sp.]